MGLINPTLPTGGQPRGSEEVDVINALTALLNLVNGGLDDANLAGAIGGAKLHASILGQWRTVVQTLFAVHDLNGSTGLLWANQGPSADANQQMSTGSPGVLTRGAPIFFPFDPADYAVVGMTTKLRLRMGLVTNNTPTGRNFVAGMHSVQGVGPVADTIGLTLAAAVAGSTVTRNAPAANSELSDVGVEFTAPAAGLYALGLNVSGSLAADSMAVAQVMLQVRHV